MRHSDKTVHKLIRNRHCCDGNVIKGQGLITGVNGDGHFPIGYASEIAYHTGKLKNKHFKTIEIKTGINH
jgi:hypothetical protein